MALAIVRTQLQFASDTLAAFEDAQSRGITLRDAGPDLAAHVDEFKSGVIANLIEGADGIENASGVFDHYTELQQEWTQRLEGIDRTDEAAILALVQEHLMSKFPQ